LWPVVLAITARWHAATKNAAAAMMFAAGMVLDLPIIKHQA